MGARRNRRPSSLFSPGSDRLIAALIEMRKSAGLSQEHLAERMGRHRSFVWKTEGGQRRLDLTEFVRWCRACSTDPVAAFKRVVAQIPVRPN
jgi:transcriptional regulator with XRE-family HTH domain